MTDNNDITLVELLQDDDIEFLTFEDGKPMEMEARYDDYGTAVDQTLTAANLDVGFMQDFDGPSRGVFLSVEGVIETLLEQIPGEDEVVVPKGAAHLAHGLLQTEVARQEDPDYDPEADRDQYGLAEKAFAEALDE